MGSGGGVGGGGGGGKKEPTEEEMADANHRNRAISSSAINRAMADAREGEEGGGGEGKVGEWGVEKTLPCVGVLMLQRE